MLVVVFQVNLGKPRFLPVLEENLRGLSGTVLWTDAPPVTQPTVSKQLEALQTFPGQSLSQIVWETSVTRWRKHKTLATSFLERQPG